MNLITCFCNKFNTEVYFNIICNNKSIILMHKKKDVFCFIKLVC